MTSITSTLKHAVNGRPLAGPYPKGSQRIFLGMGCFWGAERRMWKQPGVWVTAVGYAGGSTHNPSYEQVCDGKTGHIEVVQVIYEPEKLSTGSLLALFFESHDPTQGFRQGNDIGSQYRSAILTTDPAQVKIAEALKKDYQDKLKKSGFGQITTLIQAAGAFYYAETYHQQYLHKNPQGYCGLGGTGVSASSCGL